MRDYLFISERNQEGGEREILRTNLTTRSKIMNEIPGLSTEQLIAMLHSFDMCKVKSV